MTKETANWPNWASGQTILFGNELFFLDFLLLDIQDQIQKGKESL